MRAITLSLTLVLALVGSAGCATKKYVRGETQAVQTRVDEVQGQVEEAQTRIGRNEQAIGEASRTAQDALQRATEAGKLAEGKLLYETVLTDEKVKFGFDVAELSPEAKAALDEFANGLVSAGRLHRDPGPHRRHRRGVLQRAPRPGARRGRAAVPVAAAQVPAAPYQYHLLRRERPGRRQRQPRRPGAEPAGGAGGAELGGGDPIGRPASGG
jgi:hypothetical protein